MRTLFVVAVMVCVAGCTHKKPIMVSAPMPEVGKATAPVAIDAEVQEDSATLSVKFDRAGDRVSVDITGLDGLTVKGVQSLVAGDQVKAGETRAFTVKLERKPGRNELVVSVRGTFEGAPLARVVSFTLGDGPLEQNGVKVVTKDGETIKLMPSSP